jgi:hypothetical protein
MAIMTTKYFSPWCDRKLTVRGLMVRHRLASGGSNGYFWDCDMGPEPLPDIMPPKMIHEWDLGWNTIQVYCNINRVLYVSGEVKADWSKFATQREVWVNLRYEHSRYTVSLSLDGVGRHAEANLTPA